jgi:two-component system heavy metal sensor histidine kinase CusS
LQRELNEALERLEEGYRTMESFVGVVAHDLKTPVAIMLAETQVLDFNNATAEEIAAYQSSIVEEIRRLDGIIEGFLTLARSDHHKRLGRVSRLPVRDLILEATARCARQAEQAGVSLRPILPPSAEDEAMQLEGDADLLTTMLCNLIRNGIQHSPRGSVVEIRCDFLEGQVLLLIRDFGPGIEPTHLDKIFNRFFRGSPQKKYVQAGLGVGLAVVRSIAESHGGSVTARNCEDVGCQFIVTLPLVANN